MKIVFHGPNAINFRAGFDALLEEPHEIVEVGDALGRPGEPEHFAGADVIVGVKFDATAPGAGEAPALARPGRRHRRDRPRAPARRQRAVLLLRT